MFIPDLGSGIQKCQQLRRVVKKISCPTFFCCLKYHKIENDLIFWTDEEKKCGQINPLTPKRWKIPNDFVKIPVHLFSVWFFKKNFGLYSPMLQLFRFGVSGYIPPSPESAEPTPWLQDGKLTFAFFLWWICSNKNIFFFPYSIFPPTHNTSIEHLVKTSTF